MCEYNKRNGVQKTVLRLVCITKMCIRDRYKSGRPLIITTNLTLEELNYPTDVQHKRIYDRVLGMCVPVKFIGVNFRKEEAATKMSTAKRLFGMEDK